MTERIDSHVVPEPCGLSKTQIFALATDVADSLAYEPGESLSEVVDSLGGAISYQDVVGNTEIVRSGSIFMRPDEFRIVLPLHTGPLRDRFTIAHELGHWILHYIGTDACKAGKTMIADRFGSGRVETEANWFAASFLMPSAKFKDFWNDVKDVSAVAERFRVSEQAAEIRARSLGLI